MLETECCGNCANALDGDLANTPHATVHCFPFRIVRHDVAQPLTPYCFQPKSPDPNLSFAQILEDAEGSIVL